MNNDGIRLDFKPFPPQVRFFEAQTKYIAYGGARGGGKSWALRMKLFLLALKYSGIQILLLRRTYKELEENHILQLIALTKGVAKYNQQSKVFTFINGSRIVCGYLANEKDVLQYQGQAYDVIALDEATQFTEFQFQTLTESNRASGLIVYPVDDKIDSGFGSDSRFDGSHIGNRDCRGAAFGGSGSDCSGGDYDRSSKSFDDLGCDGFCGSGGSGRSFDDGEIFSSGRRAADVERFSPRMYFTCNPGGVGHTWVKRLFIDRIYQGAERAEDYSFIPARVYDNEFLMKYDPEYVRALENLPESRRKMMLDGDWDVFEGQHFPEFDRDIHVIKPFAIPDWWRFYRVFDYGLDMLACYIVAVDDSGFSYVVEEIHIPNLIISDAAARMLASPYSSRVFCTYAPPDMWNRSQETGKSKAELFADNGLYLTKSDNKRVAGVFALKEYLKPIVGVDGNITARLKMFDSCINLIKGLSTIQTSERDADDYATEPHELTHSVDAARYYCIMRQLSADVPIAQSDDYFDDFEPIEYDEQLQSFLSYGT